MWFGPPWLSEGGRRLAPQEASGSIWGCFGSPELEERCHWHLVDEDQGSHYTPYQAQNSPRDKEKSDPKGRQC